MQSSVISLVCKVYSWVQYYQLSKQGEGLESFGVDCSNDVHIAISLKPHPMDPMDLKYKIVIEGWNITKSII